MIAGYGFAMMAWREACRRNNEEWQIHYGPASRHHAAKPELELKCSTEFYRIVDEAEREWAFDCLRRRFSNICRTVKL